MYHLVFMWTRGICIQDFILKTKEKGKKASANPIEFVDSGNTTGNYHAYGHETPIEVQAPTMAKQPVSYLILYFYANVATPLG